jgi:hypothetical protein
MKKKLFFLFFIFSVLSASMIDDMQSQSQSQDNANDNTQNLSDIFGKYIPYLRLPESVYVQRKRFEIATEDLKYLYQKYFLKKYQRKKILKNLIETYIFKKPVVKVLKTISHIYVNPVYIQQIILPGKYKITNIISSVPFDNFSFQNNEIHFKAKSNFDFGNMVVYYTDGKNNYTMNILIDNYFQKNCKIFAKSYYCKKKSALTYDNFSLVYRYTDAKPLEDLEAILLYEKLTGKKVTRIKNNSFVTFAYKGITYFIYRNDKFGKIIIDKKKFIVKP